MAEIKIKIAGVILAAGAGRRMGGAEGTKLLLPFRDVPLLSHVVRKALVVCDPVLAVVGCNARQVTSTLNGINARLRIVHAHDWHEGQSRSLRAGLAALEPDVAGVLVFLGDQPLIRSNTSAALAAMFRNHPDSFIAPCHEGKRGNPVCIPRTWFSRVMNLQGDTGARCVLNHPDAMLRLVQVDDPGVLRDIDSPEDYNALRDI
ncbi:molybdenum cofactor cytidylyltransferase [Desulfonatronum thiosulfatophilum]|uniref:Molybdenum cofactor cytidylyltransferase n=1 Tax=Desulfonatronum thiosulfatophilum TaxID=617002 RepID=A0A1G6EHG1_9BACT|nr:nucleotidyltransferase family protein [Desulfonatronum thiosulfatophilum]SDB56913.1 molybdenum cofactor cytidylyltransferase [Desulfonatronum thiosulfatophilum]